MKPDTVILVKLGKHHRRIEGKLTRLPTQGSPVTVEFADGTHEYVTTPVVRVFYVVDEANFYVQTTNSTYRLTVKKETSNGER